ncbi:MAG: hypothetical protein JSS91_00740 [Bacteroidetes bacterium]|nr:hypothetical protein [Bacteroidota bacterium]
MTSGKFSLIWLDIKSWLITTGLMFGPLILTSFIELLMKQNFGSYTEFISLALGGLLKLAQKWKASTAYKV